METMTPRPSRSLAILVKEKALKTGDFKLASGKRSHYYLDCRNVTLCSEGAHAVGIAVCDVLRDYNVDAVGGMTMGADPIVGATLAMSSPLFRDGLKGFLVRKEPKTHGTNQLVEGPLCRGDRVAIVEDVTTTGASAMKAVEAVRDMGCTVAIVITLVDRLEGAWDFFTTQGIHFHPLLTIKELGLKPLCCEAETQTV
jgi:orotate phosphoribosyltransferase